MLTKLSTHRILLFFLFIVSSQLVLAQYDELKKDVNIPWIAEFSMDHSFSFSTNSDHQNLIKLIKFYSDPTNMDGANSDNWIINWIFTNAIGGYYQCYKDPGLSQLLSSSELQNLTASIDTIITFYPETFEEVIEIKKTEIDPSFIKSFRTQQIIYYNQKSGNFETRLIAMAPLLAIDSDNNPTPLFWIKMDTSLPNNFDIHAASVSWGALIDAKGTPLDLNLIEVVKNENNFDFRIFLQRQALNLEQPVEDAKSYGCGKFLSKKEVNDLYTSIDTIITFDPTTFQETVEIAKYELNPEDVSNYRLVQEWYYDNKKRKLMNRLKAICPLFVVQNEQIKFVPDGSRRYAKPLYYIRYN